MRALRYLGLLVGVLLGLLVVVNALAPAVARAQAIASGGGGVTDVAAALMGKAVTATSFTATAASGTNGLACTFNGCRIDYGAGAADYCVSNGATVTCYFSMSFPHGQTLSVNGIGNVGSNPTQFVSSAGWHYFPGNLPATACGTTPIVEGLLRVVSAGTGAPSKVCMCLKDSAGAFAWRNLETGATGTTTSCP